MSVLEGQMIINDRPVLIGPFTGITERRYPINGGGEVVRTWNGAAVSTVSGAWQRYGFALSFEGIVPPLLRECAWKGQFATIESSYEVVLDGYVDLSVTPRIPVPILPVARMWDPVDGSISYMDENGEVEGDGTNALPDGYTEEMITQTIFRPRIDCIITEGYDGTLVVDKVNYSGNITMEEV